MFFMWSIKCGHKTRHKRGQEKKVCYTHSSERRGTARTPGRATWEGHRDDQEAEDRNEGRKHLGPWPFLEFPQEGKSGQSKPLKMGSFE